MIIIPELWAFAHGPKEQKTVLHLRWKPYAMR